MISNIRILICVISLSLAMGCATTRQTRSAERSGFLQDYAELRAGVDEEAQLVYVNPRAEFATYDKVLIDPITIWAEPESKLAELSREDLRNLANHLYLALKTQLEQDYQAGQISKSEYEARKDQIDRSSVFQ